MITQPCRTAFAGRMYDEACNECGHFLLAHRRTDFVCALCECLDIVREAINPDTEEAT